MKILTGTLGRGHVDRYRKEIEAALESTRLRNVELVFDTGDAGAEWASGIEDCDALVILSTRALGQALSPAQSNWRSCRKSAPPTASMSLRAEVEALR